MVAGEEASTSTRWRRTSAVWEFYKLNLPADGGAPTATCLKCGLTLSAPSKNGNSHLWRHTTSDRCQRLAGERVELGSRQPTSSSISPAMAAADEPSPGDEDSYSPSPPPVEEEEKELFTVDGIYIPELYDKLIADEGQRSIEASSNESAEHFSAAASNYIPAVAQAASSSTRWFINKTKERKKAENRKRCAPDGDDESGLHCSARPDFHLRSRKEDVIESTS